MRQINDELFFRYFGTPQNLSLTLMLKKQMKHFFLNLQRWKIVQTKFCSKLVNMTSFKQKKIIFSPNRRPFMSDNLSQLSQKILSLQFEISKFEWFRPTLKVYTKKKHEKSFFGKNGEKDWGTC